MDLMQSFDTILFPSDRRPPHIVSLMTSPASFSNLHAPAQTSTARVPHPEVHMEYISEDPNIRAWHYQVCAIFFITHLVTVLTVGGISMGLPHQHNRSINSSTSNGVLTYS
jgi:hypothetical protein